MAIREINLIPDELVRRTFYFRHISLWGGILILVQLLILGGVLLYLKERKSVSTPTYEVNSIQNRLGMTLDETRKIQEKIQRLSRQEQFIDSLVHRYPLSTVIMELSFQITDAIWMEEITVSKGSNESGSMLEVKGYALSHGHLGNFLSTLSQSRILKNAILTYAVEHTLLPKKHTGSSTQPVRVIRFQLGLTVAELSK